MSVRSPCLLCGKGAREEGSFCYTCSTDYCDDCEEKGRVDGTEDGYECINCTFVESRRYVDPKSVLLWMLKKGYSGKTAQERKDAKKAYVKELIDKDKPVCANPSCKKVHHESRRRPDAWYTCDKCSLWYCDTCSLTQNRFFANPVGSYDNRCDKCFTFYPTIALSLEIEEEKVQTVVKGLSFIDRNYKNEWIDHQSTLKQLREKRKGRYVEKAEDTFKRVKKVLSKD